MAAALVRGFFISVYAIRGEKVARLKLTAMGLSIDTLTVVQEKYLLSWQEGAA